MHLNEIDTSFTVKLGNGQIHIRVTPPPPPLLPLSHQNHCTKKQIAINKKTQDVNKATEKENFLYFKYLQQSTILK